MRAGNTGKKFRPGHLAPITGIYLVTHEVRHRDRHEVVVIRGEPLPTCRTCKLNVSFEIVRPVSHITHDWDFSGPSNLVIRPQRQDTQDFRMFSRAQIQLPIQVRLHDPSFSEVIYGFSSDLSAGGMGAVICSGLPPRYKTETVRISMEKGREALSVHARVRYQNGMRFGFEFINLGMVEKETVRRMITRRKTRAAAVTN